MTPSEEDLDLLLKTWTAPPAPGSLEGRLRRAWRDRTGSRRPGMWTRWFAGLTPAAGIGAGIAAGAMVFLLVIAEAFPQSLARLSGTASPISVDYEEIEYRADGSSAIRELFTSAGGGLILSSEFPGDPWRSAQQRILDPLNLILYWMATPVRERQIARAEARMAAMKARNPALFEKHRAEAQRTCVVGDPWTVAGQETILNYSTTATRKVWMEDGKPVRFTEWNAPDLNCALLKSTTEKTVDGKLQLAFERRALKVTMNPSGAGQ